MLSHIFVSMWMENLFSGPKRLRNGWNCRICWSSLAAWWKTNLPTFWALPWLWPLLQPWSFPAFQYSLCCPYSSYKCLRLAYWLDGPTIFHLCAFSTQRGDQHSQMVPLFQISGNCTVLALWHVIIHSMWFFDILPTCWSTPQLPWELKVSTLSWLVHFHECSCLVTLDRQASKGTEKKPTTLIPPASTRIPPSCCHISHLNSHCHSTFSSSASISTTTISWTTVATLIPWQ